MVLASQTQYYRPSLGGGSAGTSTTVYPYPTTGSSTPTNFTYQTTGAPQLGQKFQSITPSGKVYGPVQTGSALGGSQTGTTFVPSGGIPASASQSQFTPLVSPPVKGVVGGNALPGSGFGESSSQFYQSVVAPSQNPETALFDTSSPWFWVVWGGLALLVLLVVVLA